MPAPKGNLNAAKNATKTQGIIRLNLGEGLPTTLRRQLNNARKYRRNLEDAVVQAKGEVNLTDAHHVDLAVRATCQIATAQFLLRTRFDKMSENDILSASREIVRAAETRNRAFSKLGLEKDQQNLIEALYDYGSDNGERMPQDGQEADKMTQPPHQDSKPSDGQSEDGSQDDE